MPIPKETVQLILNTIADTFLLGSANIAPISRSKSVHDDRVFINSSLFFRKEKNRLVDGLIDEPLKKLADERVLESFQKIVINDLSDEYNNLTSLERKENYLTSNVVSAMNNKAGNCLAMCLFGLHFLAKNKQLITGLHVEIMSFHSPLDHFVLVIKNPSTSIEDSKTNKHSIIFLDPWLNLAMTQEEFNTFWKKNFTIISSKNLNDFYAPKTYKTRHKKIPAEISFELMKVYDLKDMDLISLKLEKNSKNDSESKPIFNV